MTFKNDIGEVFAVGDRCWIRLHRGALFGWSWRRAKVDRIDRHICITRLKSGKTRVEPSQIRKRKPT